MPSLQKTFERSKIKHHIKKKCAAVLVNCDSRLFGCQTLSLNAKAEIADENKSLRTQRNILRLRTHSCNNLPYAGRPNIRCHSIFWFYENLPRCGAVEVCSARRVLRQNFATGISAQCVRGQIQNLPFLTNESSNLYLGFESTAYTTLEREKERVREGGEEGDGVVTG